LEDDFGKLVLDDDNDPNDNIEHDSGNHNDKIDSDHPDNAVKHSKSKHTINIPTTISKQTSGQNHKMSEV
jgi:hypothetical protein